MFYFLYPALSISQCRAEILGDSDGSEGEDDSDDGDDEDDQPPAAQSQGTPV